MTPLFLLPLKIAGSRYEPLIKNIRQELKKHDLIYKPFFYLSDEFGCVQDTVNIGIPFYLARPELVELNRWVGSERRETLEDHQIKALLRHECGHALFYAYNLGKNKTARKLFGRFNSKRIPLSEVDPLTTNYVNYLERWGAASMGYSRTHPEEDFSDTFAAWLDPHEDHSSYQGNALKKLKFIEKIAHRYARKKPHPSSQDLHKPQSEMKETLEFFFRKYFGAFDLESFRQKATGFLDHHLKEVFSMPSSISRGKRTAAEFLEKNKARLIRQTLHPSKRSSKHLTGINDIIEKSIERSQILHLTLPTQNTKKMIKIFSALLGLMSTLLKENGRLN